MLQLYQTMSVSNKLLESLTKHQAEQESRKRSEELAEELDVLGQDDEKKGAKWVIEKGKETRHKEDEQKAQVEWKLNDQKGRVFTYSDILLGELKRMMGEWDEYRPNGFQWLAIKNSKGIVLWFRDKDGNWFAKGMKVSGIPKYDMNGIERLMHGALDSMDRFERNRIPQKETIEHSGIII